MVRFTVAWVVALIVIACGSGQGEDGLAEPVIITGSGGFGSSGVPEAPPTDIGCADPGVVKAARAVLTSYCSSCHRKGGEAESFMSDALSASAMLSEGKLVPFKPNESRIFLRMEQGSMPPAGNPVATPGDIDAIQEWISCGAPELPPPGQETELGIVMSPEVAQSLMRQDLLTFPAAERKFQRYIISFHLLNRGESDQVLKEHGYAVSLLLNSLSWGPEVVAPVKVDEAGGIHRLDIRDYAWDGPVDVWGLLSQAYPYKAVIPTDDHRFLVENTGADLPYVRSDAVTFIVSRNELYYEALGIGPDLDAFFETLGIDLNENIAAGKVARACFAESGVSSNNRCIERHSINDPRRYGDQGDPYFWISYDFKSSTGKQNVFDNFLGPGDGERDFVHDGGEAIFSLPNGLQAYILLAADGSRLNVAPTEIVKDPRQDDGAVRNATSCFFCHDKGAGLLVKSDEILVHIDGLDSIPLEDKIKALQIYVPPEVLEELFKQDNQRYRLARLQTGVPPEVHTPVTTVDELYRKEMNLQVASAEFGREQSVIEEGLNENQADLSISILAVLTATVPREVFEDHHDNVYCALGLGTPAPLCPSSPPCAGTDGCGQSCSEVAGTCVGVSTTPPTIEDSPCRDAYLCLRDCPSADQACAEGCYKIADAGGELTELTGYLGCLVDCDKQAAPALCVASKCTGHLQACLLGVGGTGDCADIYACLGTCNTTACRIECLAAASSDESAIWIELEACWLNSCPTSAPDCLTETVTPGGDCFPLASACLD